MPTAEQLDNAYRLADGLEKVAEEWPGRFDMKSYVMSDARIGYDSIQAHIEGEHPMICGTVACAIGWAPYILGEPRGVHEEWYSYAVRLIGIDWWYDGPSYARLFGGGTARKDGDPDVGAEAAIAAARRIRQWADEQSRSNE